MSMWGIAMRNVLTRSFLKGYRSINLNGIKKWPNLSNSKRDDYEAIRSDWENVGKFIRKGTEEFEHSK